VVVDRRRRRLGDRRLGLGRLGLRLQNDRLYPIGVLVSNVRDAVKKADSTHVHGRVDPIRNED
jgi:hypothetical protein